jgi:non-canonical (house-cleaning) NTP pyrophosphatase
MYTQIYFNVRICTPSFYFLRVFYDFSAEITNLSALSGALTLTPIMVQEIFAGQEIKVCKIKQRAKTLKNIRQSSGFVHCTSTQLDLSTFEVLI